MDVVDKRVFFYAIKIKISEKASSGFYYGLQQ